MNGLDKIIFPNIVYEMIKHKDNTQTLAKQLDMHYQTLSSRLKGKKDFELPEIYKIMSLYNKSFEYLFATDDDTDKAS